MTNDSTTENTEYDDAFEEVITNIIELGKDNPEEALRVLMRYGQIDGAHHKDWVIDQAVRALSGGFYEELIAAYKNGEDGEETYGWDEGIAP